MLHAKVMCCMKHMQKSWHRSLKMHVCCLASSPGVIHKSLRGCRTMPVDIFTSWNSTGSWCVLLVYYTTIRSWDSRQSPRYPTGMPQSSPAKAASSKWENQGNRGMSEGKWRVIRNDGKCHNFADLPVHLHHRLHLWLLQSVVKST